MTTPLSAIRVLLVDDNQHMRSIVATVLAGVGVQHRQGDCDRALRPSMSEDPGRGEDAYDVEPCDWE